jgi:YHYH protein
VSLRLLLSLPAAALIALAGVASTAAAVLPLGDGHVGTQPAAGSVDACSLPSLPGGGGPPGGGAVSSVPWISGATWNSTTKPSVQGSVRWPAASYSATARGTSLVIRTNDLPVGATTGTFPIGASDPASRYDRNPNTIRAVPTVFTLPLNPRVAAQPTCLPFGPIGVTTNGVYLFDALDAQKRDAVAHEVQDACGGHPGPNGAYHYHAISPCLATQARSSSTLVGYALDGFGIYVERDAHGSLLTNSALDACHGRVSTVAWNGKQTRIYHYVATAEYPYTLGCFRGSLGSISGG